MTEAKIIIYGTNWCGDCIRTRRYLRDRAVPFQWIDVDRDLNGEAFVLKVNHGMRSVPTILFPDGSMLVEPSKEALALKLVQQAKFTPE